MAVKKEEPKKQREWSRRPEAIRRRLRDRTSDFERDLEMLDQEMGYKPVSEWDFEELARGRPKDKNGRFMTGRRPKWITTKVMNEIKERLGTEARFALSAQLGSALECVKMLVECTDVDDNGRPFVDAKTRLDAAKFIIEQTLGKAKVAVSLDTAESYREFLAGALVLPGGKSAHPVIEGTVMFDGADDDGE